MSLINFFKFSLKPSRSIVFIILSILLFSNSLSLEAKTLHPEGEYQYYWCRAANGKREAILDDKTRVDCLTKDYAIEFDFAKNWAEAVGQSLYYSNKTGEKAGVVMIMEKPADERYLERLLLLAQKYDIEVWTMFPEDIENNTLTKESIKTNIIKISKKKLILFNAV